MELEERKARASSCSVASTSSPSPSSSSPGHRQLTPHATSDADEPPSVEALHVMQLMSPDSSASPRYIAEFLHEMPHMDPKMIGRVLGEPDERSLLVLQEYANGFVFRGCSFDVALRVYLGRFLLPGEAQKIDRILQAFARSYFAANPDSKALPTEDVVYTLAFSVVLLNTDAHNPHLARRYKMTKAAFVRNYQRLLDDDSSDVTHEAKVPDQYLSKCYDSFASHPIRWIPRKPDALLADELELEFPESPLGLEIETSLDGRACLVKRYNNDRHSYSSSGSSGSSFFPRSWRTSFLSSIGSINGGANTPSSREETPSIIGWVVVAVGSDCTRQLSYDMTRYLLQTAPRPVLVRFCEPSVFFASLE